MYEGEGEEKKRRRKNEGEERKGIFNIISDSREARGLSTSVACSLASFTVCSLSLVSFLFLFFNFFCLLRPLSDQKRFLFPRIGGENRTANKAARNTQL